MRRGFVIIGTVEDSDPTALPVPPGIVAADLLFYGAGDADGTADVTLDYAGGSPEVFVSVVMTGSPINVGTAGIRVAVADNFPARISVTRSVDAAGILTVACLPRIVV